MGDPPTRHNDDSAILSCLSECEKLTDQHEKLQTVLRKAFFNITRARKSMGVNAVSENCYRDFHNPKVTLESTCTCSSKTTTTQGQRKDCCRWVASGGETADSAVGCSDASPVGLRRRKGDVGKNERTMDLTTGACSGDDVDPIYWFGGMVSPFLRQSQREFKTALAMAIEMANSVHRIQTLTPPVNDDGAVDEPGQPTVAKNANVEADPTSVDK